MNVFNSRNPAPPVNLWNVNEFERAKAERVPVVEVPQFHISVQNMLAGMGFVPDDIQ